MNRFKRAMIVIFVAICWISVQAVLQEKPQLSDSKEPVPQQDKKSKRFCLLQILKGTNKENQGNEQEQVDSSCISEEQIKFLIAQTLEH